MSLNPERREKMTTRFGKMTSEEFLKLSRVDRVRYGFEVAEGYRDEVVLPRGQCGFIWQNENGGTGSYVCEEPRGHSGPHFNDRVRCEIARGDSVSLNPEGEK